MNDNTQDNHTGVFARIRLDNNGHTVLFGKFLLEIEKWPDMYSELLLNCIARAFNNPVWAENEDEVSIKAIVADLINVSQTSSAEGKHFSRLVNSMYDKGFVNLGVRYRPTVDQFKVCGLDLVQIEAKLNRLAGPDLQKATAIYRGLAKAYYVAYDGERLADEVHKHMKHVVCYELALDFLEALDREGVVNWNDVARAEAQLADDTIKLSGNKVAVDSPRIMHGVHTNRNGEQSLVPVRISSTHPLPALDQIKRQMEPGDYIKYRAPVVKDAFSDTVPRHITVEDLEGVVIEVLTNSWSSSLAIGYKVLRRGEARNTVTETISADWEIEFSHSVFDSNEEQ